MAASFCRKKLKSSESGSCALAGLIARQQLNVEEEVECRKPLRDSSQTRSRSEKKKLKRRQQRQEGIGQSASICSNVSRFVLFLFGDISAAQ